MRTRGLPQDTGTRSSECPTAWMGHTQIITGADAGEPAIGYPTVIKAAGRLGSPVDDWYLWCTPHDNSTAPYLFTAPDPGGPWTIRNSGSPVTMALPTGYNDLSPAMVLWNPDASALWAFTTSRDLSPARQDTFFYTSSDGITWSIQNSNTAVLAASGNDTGPADGYQAAYAHVSPRDDHFIVCYQGVQKTSPDDVAHACIASGSSSGLVWSKHNSAAAYPHMAWANDSGDDVDNCGSFRPVGLLLDAGFYAYHGYIANGATTGNGRVRRLQGTGGFSAAFSDGMGLGASSSFDEKKRVISDFVYDDGKFWAFYTGATSISDNTTESIGLASCTFAQSGFDTTWGKG